MLLIRASFRRFLIFKVKENLVDQYLMKRIFMLLGFVASFSQFSCSSHLEEEEKELHFKVSSALKMDTSLSEAFVCQIQSVNHIELRAQERGFLQDIYVDEGEKVEEGQLLFKIMPLLYEAEMQSAQAELNFVNIELQNTKSLADSNIVSNNELAMAKAKYDKAKAELSLAQLHLRFTEIRAPFSGIIDRFEVRKGSLIEEGDLLTKLSDNTKMRVYFNVTEAQYLDYSIRSKEGTFNSVSLQMANQNIFPQIGKIETIEAEFDNETGNIPFRADFPNPDGLLRHGETGNIVMSSPLFGVIIIPQKATFEILDKTFVFVINDDHKVESREITIAAALEDLYVVKSGLREDEQILIEGLRKVRHGQEIEFDFFEPKKLFAELKLYAE
jgi:membrane fusion protein (multidrug efflux system)